MAQPQDDNAQAEARSRGLDMRKRYCFFDELLCTSIRETVNCSGCSCQWHDGQCSCPSGGCSECGYTGKRRTLYPVPVDGSEINGSIQNINVRAREEFPSGPNWRPGHRVINFPIAVGHKFELQVRATRQIVDLDLSTASRWVVLRAAQIIERWQVGVVLLTIREKVYQVRVCKNGECVLLREHVAAAANGAA